MIGSSTRLCYVMFTVADKLDIAYDFDDLFENVGNEKCGNFSIKFLYFRYVCYHRFGNCMTNDSEPFSLEWIFRTSGSSFHLIDPTLISFMLIPFLSLLSTLL